MEFIPPEPKQRLSLHNIKRGAAYGAITGLVVGVFGLSFSGDAVWLLAIFVGALLGLGLVVVTKLEPPILW